jgi:hypothetical protein
VADTVSPIEIPACSAVKINSSQFSNFVAKVKEHDMANKKRLCGTICIALFFIMILGACDPGGGGGLPRSVTYSGRAAGKDYTLTITEARAVYTAKAGDGYVLTITPGNLISRGTVKTAGSTLELQPSNSAVTFTVTISGETITVISGAGIALIDDTTEPAPGDCNPYAGTWKSSQYDAEMIIDNDFNAELRDQTAPNTKMAKGPIVISGTNATLTYTHVWKRGALVPDWSNDPADLAAAFGPTDVLGESNPMVGTITGSDSGSVLFGHLVKQ